MRNPISVSNVQVQDGKFVSGTMFVPMQISEGNCEGVYQYPLEIDLAGVDVIQLLPYAGASVRIKVQNVRNKGDAYVKEYIKTKTRKFHDVIARQQVEVIKLETAEDFMQAAASMKPEELKKLAAQMAQMLAQSVEPNA